MGQGCLCTSCHPGCACANLHRHCLCANQVPSGLLPVLEIDGQVFTESAVIQQVGGWATGAGWLMALAGWCLAGLGN